MRKDYLSFLVFDIILSLYFAELVFPRLSLFGNPSVVCTFCAISWLILSFIFCPRFYTQSNIHRYFVIIFYFASIIIPYAFGYPVIAHRYASMAMISLGILFYEFYEENNKLNHLKWILFFTLILSIWTVAKSLPLLIMNPYIIRSIKSSGEITQNLRNQGIGGYSFVYYIVVCSQLIFFLFLKNKGVKKWSFFSLFIFFAFFIIKSNYFMALFFMVIGIVVMTTIFLYSKNVSHKFLLCAFIYTLVILFFNFQDVINLFGDLFPKRIHRLLSFEEGNLLSAIVNEFLQDRWPVMKLSINAFMDKPIGGLMLAGDLRVLTDGSLSGFGQHSHVLDTFALYGLFMGVVNIFVLMKPFKKNGAFVRYNLTLTLPVMLVSFGLYIFNTATDAIVLAVGIFYPFIRDSKNNLIL